MLEFLRKLLRRDEALPPASARQGPAGSPGGLDPRAERRRSNGLRHFFDSIPPSRGLELLDLGALNETNVNFLAKLGGRINFVDLIGCYDRFEPPPGFEPGSVAFAREFVDKHLNYARGQFDAILGWDSLEFLDVETLHLTVPRLNEILRPGGALLTLFHNLGRGAEAPLYRYRIETLDTMTVEARGRRVLPNHFNNRNLERLFGEFASVKFFLTRDDLREVIVSR